MTQEAVSDPASGTLRSRITDSRLTGRTLVIASRVHGAVLRDRARIERSEVLSGAEVLHSRIFGSQIAAAPGHHLQITAADLDRCSVRPANGVPPSDGWILAADIERSAVASTARVLGRAAHRVRIADSQIIGAVLGPADIDNALVPRTAIVAGTVRGVAVPAHARIGFASEVTSPDHIAVIAIPGGAPVTVYRTVDGGTDCSHPHLRRHIAVAEAAERIAALSSRLPVDPLAAGLSGGGPVPALRPEGPVR